MGNQQEEVPHLVKAYDATPSKLAGAIRHLDQRVTQLEALINELKEFKRTGVEDERKPAGYSRKPAGEQSTTI